MSQRSSTGGNSGVHEARVKEEVKSVSPICPYPTCNRGSGVACWVQTNGGDALVLGPNPCTLLRCARYKLTILVIYTVASLRACPNPRPHTAVEE